MADDALAERVASMRQRENARFLETHPKSLACLARARRTMPHGVPMSWMTELYDHPPMYVAAADGIRLTDVDGNVYRDFALAITAAFCGHSPAPVVAAAARQLGRGSVMQLPTEDAIWVAEALSARYRQPKWQFTLTASQAVAEVICLARLVTGRKRVLVFEGKYHGHIPELLAVADGGRVLPEYRGVEAEDIRRTSIVQFNDLAAVERVLAHEDVALILTEPAMANVGIIEPEPGFHASLRAMAQKYGTLLAVDETQTQACHFGGLSRLWNLEADALILGKSMAGGVPLGAYGVCDRLAAEIERPAKAYEVAGEPVDQPALGGTLFANAVSLAACRAALDEVMTEPAYERAIGLAARLANRLRQRIAQAGLPWRVVQLGTRVWCCYAPLVPKNAIEVRAVDNPALRHLQRVYLANRGIWDFGWWAGPMVGLPATADDIDCYADAWDALVSELTA